MERGSSDPGKMSAKKRTAPNSKRRLFQVERRWLVYRRTVRVVGSGAKEDSEAMKGTESAASSLPSKEHRGSLSLAYDANSILK
jgi:hypothetical protein